MAHVGAGRRIKASFAPIAAGSPQSPDLTEEPTGGWKRSGLACAAAVGTTGVVLTIQTAKRILNHVRAGSATSAC